MKIWILAICLYALLGSRFNDTNTQTNLTDSSKFAFFINNFETLHLPLKIVSVSDFDKFMQSIWQNINGSNLLVHNPICKDIEKSNYNFIREKYPIDKNFHYFGFYKMKINEFFILIMRQTNDVNDDYWIKLNLYSKSGILQDTLTIAGQKVNDYDRYCEIDTNFTINIRVFKELASKENNNNTLTAIETKEKYVITKDGHLKCLSHSKEMGYFKFENNEIIRVK